MTNCDDPLDWLQEKCCWMKRRLERAKIFAVLLETLMASLHSLNHRLVQVVVWFSVGSSVMSRLVQCREQCNE